MRIIISGGSGLIGSALVNSLSRDHHEVIVLTRNPEQRPTGLPEGVRLEKWDARSASGWGHLANGADAIVNLAGQRIAPSRWTDSQKRKILTSRVEAGQAITQAVEKASDKPRVVIQASAVGFYGPRGDEKITEHDLPGNDFLAKVCQQWEDSTAGIDKMGVRRVVTRTGVVLTPEGGVLPLMALPVRLFVGGPLGSGRQWFPWIHIADEIGAIRFLMDTEAAAGAFNLSAPSPLTNKQFTQVLGRILHRPAIIPVPGFAMQLLFGEMATVVLDGQREIPARLEELGYRFRFPEAEAALKDLYQKP